MQPVNKFVPGMLIILILLLLVIGSLVTALAEGGIQIAKILPLTPSATSSPTSVLPQFTLTPTPSPTPSSTPSPTASNCQPPEGWTAIIILPSDTIDSLAELYDSTVEQLSQANCLVNDILVTGSIFYIPTLAITVTLTQLGQAGCGPPEDWVLYTVQSNDNLFQLSLAFGVSIRDLQNANCMGTSTFLKTGSQIYVPDVPTRTPKPSSTTQPTKTRKPSSTPTLTNTPSPSPTITNTPTITLTPTNTATPTQTPTPITAIPN